MDELEPVEMAIHQAKVQAHRVLRWVADLRAPLAPARQSRLLVDLPRIVEERGPLWTNPEPREWPLELGKVENLRVAARHLDGLEFEARQPFSFWAQVGPPIRARGFVPGRELREGCVVPGIGGGLCLLSNALFAAATQAGFEILERHAHSRRPPGSRAEQGTDATVAWNYVDLRFAAAQAWRLEVHLDAQELIVGIRTERRRRARPVARERRQPEARGGEDRRVRPPGLKTAPGSGSGSGSGSGAGAGAGSWAGDAGPSCLSCDQPCHYAQPDAALEIQGRRSWLLDGVWPEYADWVRGEVRGGDRLMSPIDGERLGPARYAWPRAGFDEHLQFPVHTAVRSLRSRRLASQGAARQRALLADERRLAAAMAAKLAPHDTHLVVAQNLLPHLAQLGALGGREVTVLMQRVPLCELQARLDEAAAAHPDSPTLADFRADPAVVEAEARALDEAALLITPHPEVAGLYPGKAQRIPWSLPAPGLGRGRAGPRSPGPLRLWLPVSTVGRKGAWELREALEPLGPCELWISGGELEGPSFWAGLDDLRVHHEVPSLAEVDAVVLPAWVENQPRALLRAVAAGVPVLASRACGVADLPGVAGFGIGDVAGLWDALVALRAKLGLDTAA